MTSKPSSRISFLVILVTLSMSFSVASAEFKFGSKTDEFIVTFPKKPKVTTVHMSDVQGGAFQVKRAVLTGEDWMLKAEFMPIPRREAPNDSDESLVTNAKSYADANGIQRTEIVVVQSENGPCVDLRGYKKISEVDVTIETRACYGQSSLVMLYAAAPAKGYPPKPMPLFFNSIVKAK